MGEGNIFSLFTLAGGEGYLIPGLGWGGGTPARSGWWGYSIPGLGGVPKSGLDGGGTQSLGWGCSSTRSGWWGVPRVPPHQQDWMGYPPPTGLDGVPPTIRTGWGTPPHPGLDGIPPPRSGWWGVPRVPPHQQDWMGYPPPTGLDWVPPPGLDWVPPHPGLDGGGYPPTNRTGWGTPPTNRTGWGTPPPRSGWWGVPRVTPPPMRQCSITSTCYVAGVCLLRSRRRTFLFFMISKNFIGF